MSDSALEAQGMTLSIGDTTESPAAFTAIPEVSSIQGPGGQASVIDVSDLDSTAREKRMGLQDEGQLTFVINYLPNNAVHTELRTAKANRTLKSWELTFTDSPASTWTFDGFVLGFALQNIAVDGVPQASITVEVSGAITVT